MDRKIIILIALVSILLASGSAQAQTISVTPNIPSTAPGTPATFTVSISGNPVEMDTIGFSVLYNTSVLQIQDVSRGTLIQGWGTFAWNENVPGGVIVGGVRFYDPPIPAQSSGSIAIISMTVVCSGCTFGELGQFCISKYDVELDIFTPQPLCIQQFDFCTEDIRGPFYTEWTDCSLKDDQYRFKSYIDLNNESCCEITGLDEDCHIKTDPYKRVIEYQYCDYCTPNWVEVNHSAGCSPQDTIYVTHNDTNMCYQKTLLPSDWDSRPEDKTYSCDYCTPSWECDGYGPCRSNGMQYCNSVLDKESCYSQTYLDSDKYQGDYSEFAPTECDFCIPIWECDGYGSCRTNDERYCNSVHDLNSCYQQTGLPEDEYTGDYSEFSPDTCDYCTPSWECVSYGPCQPSNIQVCDGVSDINGCYAQTGLGSDLYQGNYMEFNQSCQYTNYTGPEWFNTTANQPITIDAVDESGTSVEVFALADTVNNFINITRHADNPAGKGVPGMIPLDKYVSIDVQGDVVNNLGWVIIRIHYSDGEASGKNINENTLRVFYWNSLADEWEEISDSGANVNDNFAWAKMTHFSLYGVYGELGPYCGDGSCDSGETCSSCSADCGACPPPPPPPPPPTGPTGGLVTPPPPPENESENCTEDWSCSGWSGCVNDLQTRSCTDLNGCGTTVNKPSETRGCFISPQGQVCPQVLTPAISPSGECREFITPCDVPEGWTAVDKCPPGTKTGDSAGMSADLILAVIIVVVVVVMLMLVAYYWSRSRRAW